LFQNLSITLAAPIVSEPERGTEVFKTASKLHAQVNAENTEMSNMQV